MQARQVGRDVGVDADLEGVGAFDAGETWEWTAWHSTSTFVDGDYAGWTTTSEDQLDGDAFTAHKELFDDAGDPQGSVEESMHVIPQEDWENGVRE